MSSRSSFEEYTELVRMLEQAQSGAHFLIIIGEDEFLTNISHWAKLMESYTRITIFIVIHWCTKELVDFTNIDKTINPHDGNWSKAFFDTPRQ